MRKRNPVADRLLVELQGVEAAVFAAVERADRASLAETSAAEHLNRVAELVDLNRKVLKALRRATMLVNFFSPAGGADAAGADPALSRRRSELDQSPAKQG